MILITGANGNFGGTALDHLLETGIDPGELAGLVRSGAAAEELEGKNVDARMGDYNDYHSLVEAFRGVEKLLLVSGTDIAGRSKQHDNVVHAALEAGVSHVVYTSFERQNETDSSPIHMVASGHIYTEKILKVSGLDYTILRNNLYMESIPAFLGEHVQETGVYFPAGEGSAAFALRSEMAEAAAIVLTGEGHENKEYFISNTEAVSFRDIAAALSEITGSTISYADPDPESYSNTMSDAGASPQAIGFTMGFAAAIREGEFLPPRTDLDDLLGRKPATVKQYLSTEYSP